MKSYGVVVPDAVLQAGLEAMKGQFTASQIESVIVGFGCPYEAVPSRVVDKLLQRERRAGRISFSKGLWTTTVKDSQ